MQIKGRYLVLLIGVTLVGCAQPKETADAIYFNGSILTMEEEMEKVDAIAVKGDKILRTGTKSEIEAYRGEATTMKDLKGMALLPGFIDAHSHFSIGMKMIHQADLTSPPVGNVGNMEDLILTLESYRKTANIQEGDWIVGWGYDPDQLEERRHPNSDELSRAFPNHPVLILHVSFHMCVVNDKAMELVGINAEMPNPPGGRIVRWPGSRKPNGLLQEAAMYQALALLPTPSQDQLLALLKATQQFYASKGITTAQDGLTDLATYEFLRSAAASKQLYIDIEALASFRQIDSFLNTYAFGRSENGLRLAGVKVITDGSPQGKTAFFRDPYRTKVPGCMHDCRGFPTTDQAKLKALMAACYGQNIQLYAHANGDAAIDLLLDTHSLLADSLTLTQEDLRTVVIHSQFVRPDQLERYREFGFVPSFFTNHAFFWGDVHERNLGPERASFLSPMESARKMGITATNHTDFVITPLDQLFLVWTAASRTTRSGKILGASERLAVIDALKAVTINAAYQHKTESLKGSIKEGKLADFVILEKNPLEVPVDSIRSLEIVETIKGGEVVYVKG